MSLWKTTFWTTLATVIRLLSQFVMAKLVALFAGPSAFGIIGQFQSFISIIQLSTGGVVSSGVTKYSSEYHSNPDRLAKLIHTAIKAVFIASLITGLFIAIFSKFISKEIFQDTQYFWLFILFGFTLFGYTLNQIFLSLFNGLNEMRKYAAMTIAGSILSVILSGSLIYFYKINGYFLGLIFSQCILFYISIIYIHKLPVKIKLLTAKIDPALLKKLFKFSVMAITTSISFPLAQMLIRLHIVEHSSWADVGYWQVVTRISDAYLLIITTIIGTYALPKYSRISDNNFLKKEVFSIMVKILPFSTVLALSVYYFRHGIILILFSSDFLVAQSLFKFQLLGDIVKIASWIMANVLIAKAQIKTYIILELLFTFSFCVLSIVGFDFFGLRGLTMAFCANYIAYFFVILVWFRRFSR